MALAVAAATLDHAGGLAVTEALQYGRPLLAELCCTADSVLSEEACLKGHNSVRFSTIGPSGLRDLCLSGAAKSPEHAM